MSFYFCYCFYDIAIFPKWSITLFSICDMCRWCQTLNYRIADFKFRFNVRIVSAAYINVYTLKYNIWNIVGMQSSKQSIAHRFNFRQPNNKIERNFLSRWYSSTSSNSVAYNTWASFNLRLYYAYYFMYEMYHPKQRRTRNVP